MDAILELQPSSVTEELAVPCEIRSALLGKPFVSVIISTVLVRMSVAMGRHAIVLAKNTGGRRTLRALKWTECLINS
jgi:hypothetical protein